VPWFKVDDHFWGHTKLVGLDMASLGLWVKAGSYCACQLTDGVVTSAQIKMLGGTRRQAERLVEAGLWSVDDAPSSVRRYAFHGWSEFQPKRDDVLLKRQEARERMAKARAKRATSSDNEKMFARTTRERSHNPEFARSSHNPDPTRPDPTQKGGGVADSVTTARADVLPPSFSLVDPADARCAAHAGLPRDQVPACGACRDARLAAEQAAEDAGRVRREAIDGCQWCDDNGHISRTVDGVVQVKKCNHQEFPRFDDPAPGGFTPASSPQAHQNVLKRFK